MSTWIIMICLRTAKHAYFPFSIPVCPYTSLCEDFHEVERSTRLEAWDCKEPHGNCSEQRSEKQTSPMLQARPLQASEILSIMSVWLWNADILSRVSLEVKIKFGKISHFQRFRWIGCRARKHHCAHWMNLLH